jgi:D-alanyl-D-alanine dipeptidase
VSVFGAAIIAALSGCATKPPLIDVHAVAPTVVEDMRYFGSHNFIGRPIHGYKAAKCLLSEKAAFALAKVQNELAFFGMSLKVYDCYRPQRAVDDFVAWAADLGDTKMKAEFYPQVDKSMLFKEGYIAAKSGHSRGSTVDLTIEGLDMGTPFDLFDPLSHTVNPALTPVQRRNRLLLRATMEKHGFKNLDEEWWHFTLVNEPFSDRYFDLEIN